MIAVLFLTLLFSPATGSVYNVIPDNHYYPNTTCHHCHNLQHYLLNATKYFTSNTQLLFLAGLHHLHTDLIIQNVHNISLIGSTANGTTPDTVIQCNSSAGVVMTNITNLVLSNMTINNCGHSVAVDLKDCSYVQCSHVVVQGQTSLGIYSTNIFGASHFTHVASTILSVKYIDTQVNNIERHFLSIDHYNVLDSVFQYKINFEFNQALYRVNVSLTSSQFTLRKRHNAFIVNVHFQDSGFGQNIVLINNCHFIHNRCENIFVIDVDNKYGYEKQRGDIVKIENCHFINNTIIKPLLNIIDGPNVHIQNCVFLNNGESDMVHKVVYFATLFHNISTDIIIKNTKFVSNYGSTSLLSLHRVKLQLIGKVLFHNNSYYTNMIKLLKSSSISFVDYIQFSKNIVNSLFAYADNTNCYLLLRESVVLNFTQNKFNLFISIEHEVDVPNCYFQYFSSRQLDKQIDQGNYSVLLDNNYEVFPQLAYNNLYITHCSWLSQSTFKTAIPIDVNKQYIQYTNNSGKFPFLPSHQNMLCYCTTKNSFDCYREKFGPYYPGQTIQLGFYMDNHKPEGFKDHMTDVTALNSKLLPQTVCVVTNYSEVVQTIMDDKCNQLSYTIAFPTDNYLCELFLKISHENFDKVDVYYIEESACPVGFAKVDGICKCIPALHDVLILCNINDQTITQLANSWITVTYHSKLYVYHISTHCPFQYCLPYSSKMNFSTPNSQCQFNRTGMLCGHCQQGLSTVFGSSHCQQCSNIYLFLIVPIAIAGLVLVSLLFTLNLTVTDGTINAFILYVNIISINTPVFFPQYTPAYTFISLANLDLGIQTCFYNGMDDYAKMWLQLVFPFYLIFIATSLIITSRYSTTIQRLTARRALPVLATLFLLSYTKILLIISNVLFSYSSITHIPNKHTTLVWSVDANVPLFGFRFTILFVVCFIILLVQIPFSIILFFHRQLLRFRFISKFKPLLDAYQGPFKAKFYYWSGLQLVIRVSLLTMSSLRSSTNVTISSLLLCIIVGLHGYCCPYKKDAKNVSELVFYINLVGLYIFTLYGHDDTMTAINIFITLSGVHFATIIIYHIMTHLCGEVMKSRVRLCMNVMMNWNFRSTQAVFLMLLATIS